MKICITGVAGAVGSCVAERLKTEGHDVYGVDAYTDYYDPALKRLNARDVEAVGVSITEGDLVTGELATLIPSDTECIFHFAAQPGISSTVSFDTYLRNNLIATERLLQYATTLPQLQAFVYISTSSVYGARASGDEETLPAPTSYYGVTKLASEQLALSYARGGRLPVSVLRLFSVYGERERPEKLFRKLIAAIDRNEPFPLHKGSREHVRSFTYVGDAIEACVRLLEKLPDVHGEIFNIGSDTTATTGEGIALVEKLMGKHAEFISIPVRPGDQLETAAHIEKARRVLGYAPTTSLEEGLTREVAWYRHIAPELP